MWDKIKDFFLKRPCSFFKKFSGLANQYRGNVMCIENIQKNRVTLEKIRAAEQNTQIYVISKFNNIL